MLGYLHLSKAVRQSLLDPFILVPSLSSCPARDVRIEKDERRVIHQRGVIKTVATQVHLLFIERFALFIAHIVVAYGKDAAVHSRGFTI
jgi:hypothetical protein